MLAVAAATVLAFSAAAPGHIEQGFGDADASVVELTGHWRFRAGAPARLPPRPGRGCDKRV